MTVFARITDENAKAIAEAEFLAVEDSLIDYQDRDRFATWTCWDCPTVTPLFDAHVGVTDDLPF